MSVTTFAFYPLAFAGITYLALALWRVCQFRTDAGPGVAFRPPIAVLKPLCGDEPRLYECLRSFCDQDYPDLQLIFGVANSRDSAIPVVRRLQAEFPARDIALVVTRAYAANPKVGNLIAMMKVCRNQILVVSDSDAEIGRGALATVVQLLARPEVGAVTCVYKGAPLGGPVARLAALQINDWFMPSVLVDEALFGTEGCLGPLTAVRRAALADIGGFEALAGHLADDHQLGRLLAEHGWAVRISRQIVATTVAETDLAQLFAHEVRWALTSRTARPIGHLLTLVTFPLPVLLALLPWCWSGPAAALAGVYLALRLTLHRAIRRRLGTPAVPAWLIPLRECLCCAVWAASLVAKRVQWRGHVYLVDRDGRLVPEAAEVASRAASAGGRAQGGTR